MPLSDAEYEDAYREALLCLADAGHTVGTPIHDRDGARYCLVDGRQLSDEESDLRDQLHERIIDRWWNKIVTVAMLSCQRDANGYRYVQF